MAVTTLRLAGREFVILPKTEYASLMARASASMSRNGKRAAKSRKPSKQDVADLAAIERLKQDPNEKPIPWAEARKRLS